VNPRPETTHHRRHTAQPGPGHHEPGSPRRPPDLAALLTAPPPLTVAARCRGAAAPPLSPRPAAASASAAPPPPPAAAGRRTARGAGVCLLHHAHHHFPCDAGRPAHRRRARRPPRPQRPRQPSRPSRRGRRARRGRDGCPMGSSPSGLPCCLRAYGGLRQHTLPGISERGAASWGGGRGRALRRWRAGPVLLCPGPGGPRCPHPDSRRGMAERGMTVSALGLVGCGDRLPCRRNPVPSSWASSRGTAAGAFPGRCCPLRRLAGPRWGRRGSG
jgi:hypothetical protein